MFTDEEELADVLQPFGDLIAIGQPGEDLPKPGAGGARPAGRLWPPDVMCQTQTPAAPGADATVRSLSVMIYESGVLAMAQRLRACVAGVGNSFGSIGISTIAGLPAASAAFIVSAT